MPKNLSRKTAAKTLAAILAAALFSGCAAQRPAPAGATPWSTFMHDDARSNISTGKISMPLAVAWSKNISPFKFYNVFPKEQLSTPAISGGVLYTGSENEMFYSMDLNTGKVLWKFDADYVLEAPPAVSGGNVCFGSSDGVMRCFDKEKGKLLWSFQAKSEILSAPVIKDGTVYFSSADDKLYALSLTTGEKLWSYSRSTYQTVAPRLTSSSAVAGNRIFHFFSDGYVVALSADGGKELWSRKVVKNFDSSHPTRRTPMAYGGLVFIIDDMNAVEALSQDNGDIKGLYNITKTFDFLVIDNRVMVLVGADKVVSFDRVSGAILWKKEIERQPVSTVFASGDYLFLLSNYKTVPLGIGFLARDRGYMIALRLDDGSTVWGDKLMSTVTANASSAENNVAVLTNKGVLEVFCAK
jgi:outer membrane protein assembly factor BamB